MEKMMTKAVQERELQDNELDLVSGGETAAEAELRAAADTFNILLGITTTLMNSWGAQLQGIARQA